MSSHLTLEDRIQIQIKLDTGLSLSQIARDVGKNRSTISREILKHRIPSNIGAVGRISNRCIHRRTCKQTTLCPDMPDCMRHCAACKLCNTVCSQFQEEHCEKLSQVPYVCNGCAERTKCTLRKCFYDAKDADGAYRDMLSGCREGFNLTTGELKLIDEIVSPLIQNGQSIHHLYVNNADSLTVGERTIQRMMHENLLTASVLDQPRVCMLKPRKGNKQERKIDKNCRIGRTFEDFNIYIQTNPNVPYVEMDSVIGRKGGKVLLTMIFPSSELMLAFLRDANTAQSANACIERLYEQLGRQDYCTLFPILLTDNGSEFSDPTAMEYAPDGSLRSRVFFCNPMASYQKPHVERNHELLRRILPKRTSFDNLTQEDIDLALSHINSYGRASIGDKTPYQIFTFQHGQELAGRLLRLLCLKEIPPNEIILKPRLLQK